MFDNSLFDHVKLGDVVAKKETRDPRRRPSDTFQYVDISSVSNSQFAVVEPKSILGKDAPSRARKVIRSRDIIFATTRPYLKSIAMVPESLDNEICSTGFCVLRPTEVIASEWLFYCASSDQFVNQITSLMRGANYPAVTDKDILGIHIPLPQLKEQYRIVANIKECMERVEEIKKLQEEKAKEVHVLYKSRLVDLFDQMLLDTPFLKFGDLVAETKLGLVRSKKEQSEERSYPYVRMQDITNEGHLKTSSLIRVDANEKEVEASQLKSGDFLFNTRNSYELVGKTAIVPELSRVTIYNNNLLRIRFKRDKVISSFINHLFQHAFVKSQLEDRKNKTTSVCAIYWNKLATVEIPAPPLKVQERFVEHADIVSNLQSSIIAEMKDCEMVSKKLRESILRKAFAGEL